MKEIFRYITDYFKSLNNKVFIACSLLAALMIYLNFHYAIDSKIDEFDSIGIQFFFRYLIFLIAFALPYLFYFLFAGKNYFQEPINPFAYFLVAGHFLLENGNEYRVASIK